MTPQNVLEARIAEAWEAVLAHQASGNKNAYEMALVRWTRLANKAIQGAEVLLEWQEPRIRPRDVECPTCEADPGYNCRGMDESEVHFTRAMRA